MLIPLLSISQITIDSSHIVSIGEVRYFGDVENDADLFSIGSAGTNQTWDFSNLIAEEQDSIIVLNPQNTTYSFMFPTSNLCASGDILFYLENNWDAQTGWGQQWAYDIRAFNDEYYASNNTTTFNGYTVPTLK